MAELGKKLRRSLSGLLVRVTSFRFFSVDTQGSTTLGKPELAAMNAQATDLSAVKLGATSRALTPPDGDPPGTN